MVISREEFDKYKELEKKNAELVKENEELKLIKNNAIVVNFVEEIQNYNNGNFRSIFNDLGSGKVVLKSEDISSGVLRRLERQIVHKVEDRFSVMFEDGFHCIAKMILNKLYIGDPSNFYYDFSLTDIPFMSSARCKINEEIGKMDIESIIDDYVSRVASIVQEDLPKYTYVNKPAIRSLIDKLLNKTS